MHITIVGAGYVGLVSGSCFAEMGNTVSCVDVDVLKISNLKKGIIPIYEPGLEQMVLRNIKRKQLFFTTDLSNVIQKTDIIFIAVGTPMQADGAANLSYVYNVAAAIGQNVTRNIIVVNKSTVPVGTADEVLAIITKEIANRNLKVNVDVVSNPEFLKEGAAIDDFMTPDRVVIGANSASALAVMKELYSPFFRTHDRFITMDVKSAEMTKYASNAMLATKISFMNEIANICEKVGADANKVRIGVGSDTRIGYGFIYPGIGYGGSCFPKDVKALAKTARDNGYIPQLITAVEAVNTAQKQLLVSKIVTRFGNDLSQLTFALWGLSYKPGTNDMREAPSIVIVKELVKRGAHIVAYDPKAMPEAKHKYLKNITNINYVDYKYNAVPNADALILLTEWKEFRSPDFTELKQQLKTPIIFDGRNQYNAFNLKDKGFEYYQIGKE